MVSLVAFFSIVVAMVAVNAASAKGNAPLRSDTNYEFVAPAGVFGPNGLLIWQGDIDGDLNGCIQWWSPSPEGPRVTGQATHYDEVWEIWERCDGFTGETLLLTGADRGTTTVRNLKNSIWRANGTVTGPQDSELVGRRMHSGGTVEWLLNEDGVPVFFNGAPVPVGGEGVFRVN
ncbi:MAG: hypothetical protein ACN4GZ_06475 [Acidimicrobiales bacterium]